MSRNLLYPVLGVLLIAVGALGFWAYQEQNSNAVELNVGGRSISVETR
jgi:Na+/proline symporter